MSRTKNASRNIVFGFINKTIVLLFPFVLRTVLIKSLGSEYLGLNGLFTSILQVLNLAELGFSSAIVFSMYKPIVDKDSDTICALMNLYKKIYRIIGLIIFLIGLSLLPLLPFLIKGSYPSEINIYYLYIIYLINTGVSYFLFAYKSSLLIAHQRSDITSNIQSVTYILQYVFQIIVLIKLKNYYLFISIQILSTILNNILVAFITKKRYPNYVCKGNIDETTKNNIKKRVSGLMINKVCQTTRNSLDSICISCFLGLKVVAIYSNYYSIIQALMGFLSILSSSIIAGIGNSIVVESEEKNYNDMKKINFLYMFISGWITVCLLCLYQPFMKIWMGEKYMFSNSVIILLCIYFYSLEMGVIRGAYSDAKGLWFENRYRAIAESIANILLNVLLVNYLGIYGIILGTLISLLIINFGYGSQILYKHYFIKERISDYFLDHGTYATITLMICVITYFICSFIKIDGIIGLFIKAIICLFIPIILYLLIYSRTKIFKESMSYFKKINFVKKILNKLKKIKRSN